MSGHGWVRPNPNGMKARCGGPAICPECRAEANPTADCPRAQTLPEETTEPASQERINAHILIVAGDRMASLLNWIIEEPDSGLGAEELSAIREAAKADLTWWESCVKLNGFKSPAGPGGFYRAREEATDASSV